MRSVLSIKPLIGMEHGVIVPMGRAHSRGQACRQMARLVAQAAGNGKAKVAHIQMGALREVQQIPALAVHTGPGTAGVCYYTIDG